MKKEIALVCPICGGRVFKDHAGRILERCTGCQSKGRTRIMAMTLRFVDVRDNGLPVIHFAPEQSLQDVLIAKYGGARYTPADFTPEMYDRWSKVPLRKIDLSHPNDFLAKGSVEGLVHSHVLEHIPGSIERVISQMNDAIAPGGYHLFVVPIHSGWYREDMDPALSAEERTEKFNQLDHLRMFGTEDFEDRCLRLFEKNFTRIDLKSKISSEDLIRASVDQSAVKKYTGQTPFLFIKN